MPNVDVVKACAKLWQARGERFMAGADCTESRTLAEDGCRLARLTLSEGADPLAVLEAWAAGLQDAVAENARLRAWLGATTDLQWEAGTYRYHAERWGCGAWSCCRILDTAHALWLTLSGAWVPFGDVCLWSSLDALLAELERQGLWPPEGDSGE